MPEANNLDNEFWILVGIIAIPILLGLLVGLCLFINDFSQELRYLNNEIRRTEVPSVGTGFANDGDYGYL